MTKIDNSVLTDMVASRIKGRITTTGAPQDLTGTQTTALLDVFTGDTGVNAKVKGLVPAPANGDAAAAKFLKADGTWAVASSSTLDTTVSILALQIADNTNFALFGYDWVADALDTLTYVDVAGATNLDTSVAGILKATPIFTEEKSITGTNTNSNGWTYVNRTIAVDNDAVVSGIYIWSSAAYAGTARILLRNSATSYTFVTGAAAAFSHTGSSTWEFFPFTAPVTMASSGNFYCSTYSPSTIQQGQASVTARSYYNGDVTGTQASGWTELATGNAPSIGVRYLTGSNGNMIVSSTSFTAASVPTKIKAVIRVKEVDAAVAGTDYTLEGSRDGGTTWTAMTLTELFTSPSPTAGIRVVEAFDTSVTSQPSGSAPRWRFKNLNGKSVEFHGIRISWS